jgi:hypothetical protein
LAGSTTKKVLVRRFDRETLPGYVHPASFQQPEGVELLSVDGNISVVPYDEVKTVAFVREFEAPGDSPKLTFLTRPKMEGLWLSLKFRDHEVMEGVLPNNLLQIERFGFTVVPPDPFGNQQKIFVPRAALQAVEVLGVVGSPLTKRKPKAPVAKEQFGLFEE